MASQCNGCPRRHQRRGTREAPPVGGIKTCREIQLCLSSVPRPHPHPHPRPTPRRRVGGTPMGTRGDLQRRPTSPQGGCTSPNPNHITTFRSPTTKQKDGLTMATDRRPQHPTKYSKKPWHARVKRNGEEFHLGYFVTREEALQAERDFSANYPSMRGNVHAH